MPPLTLELHAQPGGQAAIGQALEAQERLVVDAILILVAAQQVDPFDADIDMVVDIIVDAGVELSPGAIDQRQAEKEGIVRHIARPPRIAQPRVQSVFVIEQRCIIGVFRQVRQRDQILRSRISELGEHGARAIGGAIFVRRAAGLLIGEIADEAENDFSVIETEKGKEYRANGAKLERAKIRIDARKWTASKLAPKKYGNNLKVESDNKHTGEMKIIFENYGGADDADC